MVFIVFVRNVEIKKRMWNNLVIVDTNILMRDTSLSELFKAFDNIHIPIEVLSELDNLKTKEGDRGYFARNAIRKIRENMEDVSFLIHENTSLLNRKNMIVDDIIIEHVKINPKATLLTNDINMEIKAKALGLKCRNFYGLNRNSIPPVQTVHMSDREYELFLKQKGHKKLKDVPVGQFAKIVNENGDVRNTYRFLGEKMWDCVKRNAEIKNYIYSLKGRDVYQDCAIRSLEEDEMTVITGPAGTGKTLLALGYCLEEMSRTGAVINIFVNPVKTRDTEQLGYYPGTRDEKLLSSFIGGILGSKFGDLIEVERMISAGGLRIYPFSDIRGIEVNSGDIMYITEAQNLSIDLIKLAIQRCARGAKLVIEGDAEAQVDRKNFEGENNGLQRVIDVFTGTMEADFGHVHLPIIYRSRMAQKAEEL